MSLIHRGIATFTLDYGRCPPWLFKRMVKLSRIIIFSIIEFFGADEFLKRLADPVWFQALGSLLAFDWNASGLTTTTMGALKEALRGFECNLGIFIAGGKGKTSRKTPQQILSWAEKINLDYNQAEKYSYLSRLTAKVDSALIQDGFQIYHHNFIFTESGSWAVIQQGMNTHFQKARRYHWYSQKVKDLTIEPHNAIQSEVVLPKVFNLTSKKSLSNREGIMKIIKHKKDLFYEIRRLEKNSRQLTILDLSNNDFPYNPKIKEALENIVKNQPNNFEKLLMTEKVGPKTIRALSLVSELIFGARPSYEDPIRYTYAFGGKDGIPYPVDRKTYDLTIQVIEKAIKKSSLGYYEKEKILRKNEKLFNQLKIKKDTFNRI